MSKQSLGKTVSADPQHLKRTPWRRFAQPSQSCDADDDANSIITRLRERGYERGHAVLCANSRGARPTTEGPLDVDRLTIRKHCNQEHVRIQGPGANRPSLGPLRPSTRGEFQVNLRAAAFAEDEPESQLQRVRGRAVHPLEADGCDTGALVHVAGFGAQSGAQEEGATRRRPPGGPDGKPANFGERFELGSGSKAPGVHFRWHQASPKPRAFLASHQSHTCKHREGLLEHSRPQRCQLEVKREGERAQLTGKFDVQGHVVGHRREQPADRRGGDIQRTHAPR
mmetsp:Transcript_115682/g.327109  ORF Transcript_115682/g.327109 Transcript_115682/m.327109 type:complete len:283 (-) Transcript_115682:206-1054(-)|eukprot:CAMPEP_0117547950 /NCGR_PEP_ID=MMETSP0784-20121206/47397_1 /TAXON_ID=39447 /ORGANISM="" /LENGTH=282 /DNA_ID=CAMNT_0005344889 /DNA_START=65 /DNA_END=913 /DNA_ORIENTATION=-